MSGLNSPPESSLFTISPDQKTKYEVQFKKICPTGDLVSGTQARELMLQSGLPHKTLAHIWNLSDVDADGKMDINEFSIALHLIALKMKGVELPQVLPQSLKVLVKPPSFAAFNNEQINVNNKTPGVVSPSNSVKQKMGEIAKPLTSSSPTTIAVEWAIPQQTKLKYTQMFNSHDRQRTNFLTQNQARNILLESKLPQQVLANIWNLSDVDVDGKLTCEEFVLAMHLVDKAKRNEPLPTKLPPDLVPPSYRRSSGSLSHASSLDDAPEHNDMSGISKSSFEDKRRENYEKGQAELDRRRAALQEQERRAREERERKEREDNARKEKERLERKRQEELELQKQKFRDQELEREEQKRRQQEVRELARKEIEKQRQRELEQARKSELLAQRTRIMDELHKLKSRKKALFIEHEQVDKQLEEKKRSVGLVRDKVFKTKTDIDGMRTKRDESLAKQSQIKTQMKTLTEKQLFVEQEKVRLATQLKSLIANTSNGLNPEQQLTSFALILQAKQTQINQIRSQLERTEQEFKSKKEDVIGSRKELEKLKRSFQEKHREALKFSDRLEEKRVEAEKVRDGKSTSNYASDYNVAWGQEVPTNFEWPSATETKTAAPATTRTKFPYRCVYEFEARNPDEITIKPGNLIIVDISACSEEGWLSGEINGKVGWFPKDYAVLEKDEQTEDLQNIPSASNTSTVEQIQPTVSDGASVFQIAKSLYDYSATEPDHLSFGKDCQIRITQQQDGWCYGELLDTTGNSTGSSGWFPENYIQIDSQNISDNSQLPSSDNDVNKSQYYISLYAFEKVEPGDLGFDVDELIKVEKQEGEWWTGVIIDRKTGNEVADRRGIFPSNFIQPADPANIPKSISADTASISNNSNTQTTTKTAKSQQSLDRKESVKITDSPKPSKKSKSKKVEIVTAVAAYTATGAEQLSLEVGQLIQVRKKTQTGWWEGELQAKGKKKQIGWFPSSYVKPMGSSGTSGSSNRNTPEPATTNVPNKSVNDEPEIERVQALYPFNAQREDEISFVKDDVIRVLGKSDPTWWRGHNVRSGAVGLFPSNHVQLITNSTTTSNMTKPNQESTLKNFLLPYEEHQMIEDEFDDSFDGSHASGEFFYNDDSFDDDDDDDDDEMDDNSERKEMTSINDNHNNEESNLAQDKTSILNTRKNLIYELVTTEYDYVMDLYFVIENYMNRIKSSNIISQEQFVSIFDQIEEIYKINFQFFNDINQRLKSSIDLQIGDLLLKHLKQMPYCYKKFFTNQITSPNRLQQIMENNLQFSKLLNQIVIDTKSYLPLSSYLIKPMQRITRYPLLIEKIYKCTMADHVDYNDYFESLKQAKKLCSEVNEICRKTDNIDKLLWLQKKVLLSRKYIFCPIYFNSETQFLGPRTLIRYGILEKHSSSKVLIGFLFNDFFMLVFPDKKSLKLNNVLNFFQDKDALSANYRLQMRPLLLDTIRIINIPSFEAIVDPRVFRLQIKSEDRHITLRANSSSDCNKWLNDIYMAQDNFLRIQNEMKRINCEKVIDHKRRPIGNLFITVVEAVQIYPINNFVWVRCEVVIGKNWDHLSSESLKTTKVWLTESKQLNKNKGRHRSINLLSKSNNLKPSDRLNNYNNDSNGPFRVEWNCDKKFILTTLDENLLIRCQAFNPFQPIRCLGEQDISLRQLFEESKFVEGTVSKSISLISPHQKHFQTVTKTYQPELLLKYRFIFNSN